MTGRVYLHIGTMKSATTYLQKLLDLNADEAARQGLSWPGAEACFRASGDLFEGNRDRPGVTGAWDRFDRLVKRSDGNVLFSNELLGMAGESKRKRLVEALAPADVRIVVTARDLGRVVPSQWQTGMRNRKTTTWSRYVDAICAEEPNPVRRWFWRRHDIPAMLRRWSRLVPLDRITLVTVPPPASDPAVVGRRFAAAIGIDAGRFRQPATVNTSLGAVSAELMRRLNERTGDFEQLQYMWAFKNGLSRHILASRTDRESPIVMGTATHRAISRRAAQMVDRLERMGVRVIGDLGDLMPQPPPGTAVDPGATGVPDLLDAAVDALVGLGIALADVRVEHDLLIRDVERFLGIRDPHRSTVNDELPVDEDSDGDETMPTARLTTSSLLRGRLEQLVKAPELV